MAKKKNSSGAKLAAADYDPLLVAISSRAVDTCLMGAKCLALLEDPRAFGLLMQLSREDDPNVRLETCRSFEQLGDQRATDRLCALLDDGEVKVRDAAFTALGKICSAAEVPLEAATQGMAVSHEDVRMRGFELLVRHAKKSKSNLKSDEVLELLRQALNDSKTVRNEAFKFVLNSGVGGGDDATLRFALNSSHADVRRDALNEIMAEEKQPWAASLILEMLDDPDQSIREEAFEYLEKKNKSANPAEKTEWLSAAIGSRHTDIRLSACKQLVKLNSPEAQAVLKQAIDDESIEVRQFALRSLIARNATDDLVEALESAHVGVKLSAATALARQGDGRAKPVLEEFANVEMPNAAQDGEEKVELWESLTKKALQGLAELEDPSTVPLFVEKATHANAKVREVAAAGLRWVAGPDSLEALQPLLQHEDDNVKLSAAYASALHGDLLAGRMVLATDGNEPVDWSDRLCTAIALGEATENQLVQMLDMSNNTVYPNSALIVLLCRDWMMHDGSPRRIVAALAARDARLRLIAASALQKFADSKSLEQVIVDVFNNRSDGKPLAIDPKIIRTVASVLVFGRPPLLCRVIRHLDKLAETKQEKWDNGWNWISTRYVDEIAEAIASADSQKLDSIETTVETLDQLAFGTYVGLAREQGGYHTWRNHPRFGWSIANVRCAALGRLQAMADSDKEYLAPTISVITHTCGDPLQPVRAKAFEILEKLGVDDRRRAEIGISSGQLDLAVEGLNLLTQSAKKDERKEILKQAILNQPSDIGIAAAKMLRDDAGSVEACQICLEASPQVAHASVSWLADDYNDKPAAKKMLQKLALDSPDSVRERAIDALVKAKDDTAFDALVAAVNETNPKIDRAKCYKWFSQLGDSRANEFLLNLFDNPDLAIDSKKLFKVVGEFRDPAAAPKLLELMEREDLTKGAANVVYKISGFDQPILDPQDDWPDRLWVDSQHPRHGDVLASLMTRANELNQPKLCSGYVASARWCLTDEVDAPLSKWVSHPDEKLRRVAIEAISFRAEKREGSVDPLKSAVEHRDPLTQFLAAEGLAKAGHDDGIQVLMLAVEMIDDLNIRRRAVLALGCLADERALDQLLKLVTHDGHALQDCAAEAIGHLGRSIQKEKIFKILMSLVARQGTAGRQALVGLRYMDVPEGWDKIRAEAKSTIETKMRVVAKQQLGYDSTDATKDLIVDLLENSANDLNVVLASARRCFGLDSIVPDMAYLKGRQHNTGRLGDVELECLNRVCEHATPDQIFQLVDHCPSRARTRLANHLLALEPLPIKEATEALSDPDPQTVQLAAHVVGRNGDKKSDKAIATALENWMTKYSELSLLLKRSNRAGDNEFFDSGSAISRLIWAASRVGGGQKQLIDMIVSHEPDDHFTVLRQSAMEALQNGKL